MFIISLLNNIGDYDEKKAILIELSSNDKSLTLSEHILLRLLSKCKIWDSAVYKGIQEYTENELKEFPLAPIDLIEAKETWLTTLIEVSNNRDIISTEPEPISIFFRWGQLNENDFTQVQDYIDKLTDNETGIKAFIDCFDEGKGLNGIEGLIKNLPEMIKTIESLDEKAPFGSEIVKYLKMVMEKIETPLAK